MSSAGTPTLIASVQRALRLLEAVGAGDRPATAKGLARSLGMPLPTVYHLLRTLVHEGYVRRLDDGYVLGSCVDTLLQGSRVQSAASRARPVLQALRDELRAAAYLSLYEDGEITLIDIAESPKAPCVDLWVGMREAGHATAFGKCILSRLGRTDRDDYLSRHELADLTPRTITDARVLERKLQGQRHIVTDHEEYLLGTACAAAPVLAPGLVGAVAVSAPSRRLGTLLAEGERIARAAQRIARALAVRGRPGPDR